jgi:hypothetical protein
LEGGIYDLALAEKFGPLDAQALTYRNVARLFMIGLGFWEVYPEQAIYYFQQVASAAPYLRDASGWTARERYRAVLIQYADQLAGEEQWCEAEEYYLIAISIRSEFSLEEKLVFVSVNCSPPTPTPAPITETPTPTETSTLVYISTDTPSSPATPQVSLTPTQVISSPTPTDVQPAPTTQIPIPSATSTPTPVLTEEPISTETPIIEASATPTPTLIPEATDTPVSPLPPTDTPQPTQGDAPISTATTETSEGMIIMVDHNE